MKKFLSLVSILLLCSVAVIAQQQDPMTRFAKTYYRSNPFLTDFGSFLDHVISDPDLKDKKKQYRTDSTLFVFNGTFTQYNPFVFKPARIDVSLIEQNVQLYEGRPEGDTIMLYVIVAFGDSTAKGLEDLKSEYSRIKRKCDRYFFDGKEEPIAEGSVTGMASNYFVSYAQMSPATVEWVQGIANRPPILRLTIRIRNRGNEAVLPMSLYDSQ